MDSWLCSRFCKTVLFTKTTEGGHYSKKVITRTITSSDSLKAQAKYSGLCTNGLGILTCTMTDLCRRTRLMLHLNEFSVEGKHFKSFFRWNKWSRRSFNVRESLAFLPCIDSISFRNSSIMASSYFARFECHIEQWKKYFPWASVIPDFFFEGPTHVFSLSNKNSSRYHSHLCSRSVLQFL